MKTQAERKSRRTNHKACAGVNSTDTGILLDLTAEIKMLRDLIQKIYNLNHAFESDELPANLDIISTLSQASTRLAALIKVQRALSADSSSGAGENFILNELTAVAKELGFMED
jgi:hypothetical protein